MPLFYFDVIDGQFRRDDKGQHLATRSDLEHELRRRLSEIVLQDENPLRAHVKVRDEAHDLVVTATISAVIDYPDTHH